MMDHFPIYKQLYEKDGGRISKIFQREKQSLIQQLLHFPSQYKPKQQIRTVLIDQFMIKNRNKFHQQQYQFDRKPLVKVVAPVNQDKSFSKTSIIGNFIKQNDVYSNNIDSNNNYEKIIVDRNHRNQTALSPNKNRLKPFLAKSQLFGGYSYEAQQFGHDASNKSPSILDVSNNLSQINKFKSQQKQQIFFCQQDSVIKSRKQPQLQKSQEQQSKMGSGNQKQVINQVQAFEKFNSIFRKRQTAENSRVSNLTSKLFGNQQPNQLIHNVKQFQVQGQVHHPSESEQFIERVENQNLNIPNEQSSENMFDFNSQLLQVQKSQIERNSQCKSTGKPSKLHALIMKTVNIEDKKNINRNIPSKTEKNPIGQNILDKQLLKGEQSSHDNFFENLQHFEHSKPKLQNKVIKIDLQQESSRSKSLLKASQSDFQFESEDNNPKQNEKNRSGTQIIEQKQAQQIEKNRYSKKIKIRRIDSRQKDSSSSEPSNSYISFSKLPSFEESYSAKSFSKIESNYQTVPYKQQDSRPKNPQNKGQPKKKPDNLETSQKQTKQNKGISIISKQNGYLEQQLSDDLFQNYESSSQTINRKTGEPLAAVIEETDQQGSIFIPNLQQTPSIKVKNSVSEELPKEQMAVPQDLSSIKFESDNKISDHQFSRTHTQKQLQKQDEVDQIKKYAIQDVKKDVQKLGEKMLQDLDIQSASDVSSSSLQKRNLNKKSKSDDLFNDIDAYNDYSQVIEDIHKLKAKILKDNGQSFD